MNSVSRKEASGTAETDISSQTVKSSPKKLQAEMLGPAASLFTLSQNAEDFFISPKEPLPARCTIKPVALFRQRSFPDVNTVMGRLTLSNGCDEAVLYRPFTLDSERSINKLFFPVEMSPEDDFTVSPNRWRNFEAIGKVLCRDAGVPWNGLSDAEIDSLVKYVPWPEPIEGCMLHALAQWSHSLGSCVIEIGSFRGRSASMLSLALNGVGSDSPLLSVDPHCDQPYNTVHVRTALEQIGQGERLVQVRYGSDRVARMLRPESASLIFIDGDHSRDQVLADFGNYKELLAPGGCMVFHDYGYGNHNNRPDAAPDVRPAIDEHVLTDSDLEPLMLAHTQFAFVKKS